MAHQVLTEGETLALLRAIGRVVSDPLLPVEEKVRRIMVLYPRSSEEGLRVALKVISEEDAE